MRIYRYPVQSLTGDYLRSAAGLAVGLAVLLSVPATPVIFSVFGTVVALFGYFGVRTLQRHMLKVAVTDVEICNSGFGTRVIAWNKLQSVKLRYFGTKRHQRGGGGGGSGGSGGGSGSGFMQLTLKGGGTSLTYESSLEGFDHIAWRATRAARDNGVAVDPTSAGNLLAIGVDADGELPPPLDLGDETAEP